MKVFHSEPCLKSLKQWLHLVDGLDKASYEHQQSTTSVNRHQALSGWRIVRVWSRAWGWKVVVTTTVTVSLKSVYR